MPVTEVTFTANFLVRHLHIGAPEQASDGFFLSDADADHMLARTVERIRHGEQEGLTPRHAGRIQLTTPSTTMMPERTVVERMKRDIMEALNSSAVPVAAGARVEFSINLPGTMNISADWLEGRRRRPNVGFDTYARVGGMVEHIGVGCDRLVVHHFERLSARPLPFDLRVH